MSCPFAKHSEIFGKPNEGVHSYRLFDIAVVDLLATALVSGAISFTFNKNFIVILLILLLLGIIFHRLFCVKTSIDKLLFSNIYK
jgi:hypothetical protein